MDEWLKKQVTNTDLVIVDFYADWCGPCKAVSPVLDSLAEDDPSISIVKIDVDDPTKYETVLEFQIRQVPTLLIFHKGELKKTLMGARTKASLQTEILNIYGRETT
jgi:thioredoxin 1